MIEAKELRIGDFVHHTMMTNVHIGKVLSIQEKIIKVKTDKMTVSVKTLKNGEVLQVEPIPITEEWLIKLGFESVQEFIACLQSNIFEVSFRLDEFTVNQIMSLPIHKLQNLYFALTGEELTIEI